MITCSSRAWLIGTIVAPLILVVGSAGANLTIPCFTVQNEEWDGPMPVVAGMTLLRTTGLNAGAIENESFYDGLLSGDGFSHNENRAVGSYDCDDCWDGIFTWGYGIHDQTSNEFGVMSVTVTIHSSKDDTNAIGCAWSDPLEVYSRSVNTSGGGGDSVHWTEASSEMAASSVCGTT